MAFLNDRCARVPLTPKVVTACAPFSCGNKDLDEFFTTDYLDYAKQLMGKTYAFKDIVSPSQMGAEFKDDESLPYWFFPGATVHVKANADLSSCTVTKAS